MKMTRSGPKLTGKQKAHLTNEFVSGNRDLERWKSLYPGTSIPSLAGLLSTLTNREKRGEIIEPKGNGRTTATASAKGPEMAGEEVPVASVSSPPPPGTVSPPQPPGSRRPTLAEITGFIPVGTPDPTIDENAYGKWLIRRLNPPDGVVGEEQHPFETSDLMKKYGGGYYECVFMQEGKPNQPHRVKIAGPPRQVAPSFAPPLAIAPGADRNAKPSPSPFGELAPGLKIDPDERLVRHFEAFSKLTDQAERKAVERLAPERGTEAARIAGEASIATAAINALKDTQSGRESKGELLESLIRHQSEERKTMEMRLAEERRGQELRHQQDMERERVRAQQDIERERERARHELEVEKERMAREDARQKEFLTRIEAVNKRREEIERERWERLEEEHNQAVEANRLFIEEERKKILIEEDRRRKEWQDREEEKKKHLDEYLELKRALGADNTVETQRMWANTLTDLFGRMERKAELIFSNRAGALPGGHLAMAGAGSPAAIAASARAAAPGHLSPTMEDGSVPAADLIFKSQIFNDVFRGEIDINIQNQNPPDVFITGIQGILEMNGNDPRVKVFLSYFFARTWEQILREAEGRLHPDSMAVWKTAYAKPWFDAVRGRFLGLDQPPAAPAPPAPPAPAAPAPTETQPQEGEPVVRL